MRFCWVCALLIVVCSHGVMMDSRYASCKTPSVKNGRIRSRQRGRNIRFVCNPGYELIGERTAFCRNGQWDEDIPKCVRPTCAKIDTPPVNGLMRSTGNGGVMNFYCKPGYEIKGSSVIFCDGIHWDNHKPSCLPHGTKPELFCDFEDPDLCHWTHDLNHDMDWVRDSYKTPTGYSMPTGPSHDHTKGNGSNGHYMYLESSSRRINDTARLISPIFSTMEGNICLEFWYHMHGRTIGTLNAYMKKASDPWPLKETNKVFSKSGNQGNIWYREFVDLGPIPEEFQIIMEGVRGNGYFSDIAIDDIKIIPKCIFENFIRSTTEFLVPVSDVPKTMESCENRCGEKAFGNESSNIIACDCDDLCYENNRCCRDYIDVCLVSLPAIDSTTEELSSSSDYIVKNIVNNTISIDTTTTMNISALRSGETTTIRTTTKQQITPVKRPITTNIVKPVTEKPKVFQPTMPTLYFVKAPTTAKIVEVVIPKFVQNKNTSKITFVKPKTQTPVYRYHDDIEVPTKIDNDEELLLTSPLPIEEDSNDINELGIQDKEDYVEKITNEKDYPFKILGEVPEHIGEIKTDFKQVNEEQSGLIFVIITSVCAIVLFGVLAGVLLVKFKFIWFRRRIASGQGDSQSDVRFLTADEVLDFGLDKDYDEL